ncbi:MAG: CocE/NonD family hydrolase [Bacteroidales bacterium]
MRLLLLSLCLLVFAMIKAQNIDAGWFRKNYTKKEYYITMRDGVKLFTSVYIPNSSSEKHPILMERTPYSCSPYGENNYREYWAYSYIKEYLKEGYILVTQDVRGRWMSEGEYMNIRPFNPDKKGIEIDESSDTYDAIDWLIKNIPNNNGNVGVFGISYPGFYSTMAAASNHPALKAVSPQAPVTNWFIGDDFHHNGAFFQLDAFSFYSALGSGFGVPHPRPISVAAPSAPYPCYDNYKFFLETGSLKNLTNYMGDSIAFWKDLMSHPNYDEWWKARDARNATKNLKPAILWVGGMFDAEDVWGAWNSYKAAEENNPGKEFNKLVMGPWYHVQWANNDGTQLGHIQFGQNTSKYYQENFEVPFFNFFLKGKGDISKIAEASVFFTGENKWQFFEKWPPVNGRNIVLYLQPNGKLSEKKPALANSFSAYISDPAKPVPYQEDVHFTRTRTYMVDDQRFASRRPDVLVFESEILTEDTRMAGNVVADLFTSISTTDADFVVKIIDVFPDDAGYNDPNIYSDDENVLPYPMGGYQMLVRAEIFRGRYRKSYENPSAFSPGKVEEVKFELPSSAHTFLKGHKIMVQVQSSWFPLVDRNPQQFTDIYHCEVKDFIKSEIKIHHSTQFSSHVLIPVLK